MIAFKPISNFFELFYPRICESCNDNLVKNEEVLCTRCLLELPFTHFQYDADNDVARIFWGRVPVKRAASLFYFHKEGHVQKLLHKLKYKDQPEIGIYLGKLIGYQLQGTGFNETEVIVPVPLHLKKRRKRGYNQCEYIARGMSEVMNKPVNTSALRRVIANPSQTKRHRYERWLNAENVFKLTKPDQVKDKHVLLVDDVVTTGATLESCVSELLKGEGTSVSIITVAHA